MATLAGIRDGSNAEVKSTSCPEETFWFDCLMTRLLATNVPHVNLGLLPFEDEGEEEKLMEGEQMSSFSLDDLLV